MVATADKRDYYEVLGVDRTATQDQIKQAYRELAMTSHPDRNPAPDATDRFREIAEAYAVLCDPAKREQYDVAGHAGVSERWSTEDILRGFDFGDFFGGRFADVGGIFGDLFGGRSHRGPVKPHGADLHHELSLSVEEAAKGGERLISITLGSLQNLRGQRRKARHTADHLHRVSRQRPKTTNKDREGNALRHNHVVRALFRPRNIHRIAVP